MKACKNIRQALDIALDVMRKTPHTLSKKSATELHYGREPNTEIGNLLNLDALRNITNDCSSAKPDTLQVHSFNIAGGVSHQLPMKQKKGTKRARNYSFFFHGKRITKPKFDSAYSDKIEVGISGPKHTVTTTDNRTLIETHKETNF